MADFQYFGMVCSPSPTLSSTWLRPRGKIADAVLKGIYRQRWLAIAVACVSVALALVAPRAAMGLYSVETMPLPGSQPRSLPDPPTPRHGHM